MIESTLKKHAKKLIGLPRKIRAAAYRSVPSLLGHQVAGDLVQLYRNDAQFDTIVSFNQFIEFYSGLQSAEIIFKITAYNRNGKECGVAELNLRKGAHQTELKKLIPNLDLYGIFKVSMRLSERYFEELNYLGCFSPQFMTIYRPKDTVSATQMIHSHKKAQGYLMVRTVKRRSADVEALSSDSELIFYVLNSSKSSLKVSINLSSGDSLDSDIFKAVVLPGYGCGTVSFSEGELSKLEGKNVRILYEFNRPVDHMKPIIFRKLPSGAWSCNHT